MRAYILKRFLMIVLLLSSVSVYSIPPLKFLYLVATLAFAKDGGAIPTVDDTEASGGETSADGSGASNDLSRGAENQKGLICMPESQFYRLKAQAENAFYWVSHDENLSDSSETKSEIENKDGQLGKGQHGKRVGCERNLHKKVQLLRTCNSQKETCRAAKDECRKALNKYHSKSNNGTTIHQPQKRSGKSNNRR